MYHPGGVGFGFFGLVWGCRVLPLSRLIEITPRSGAVFLRILVSVIIFVFVLNITDRVTDLNYIEIYLITDFPTIRGFTLYENVHIYSLDIVISNTNYFYI